MFFGGLNGVKNDQTIFFRNKYMQSGAFWMTKWAQAVPKAPIPPIGSPRGVERPRRSELDSESNPKLRDRNLGLDSPFFEKVGSSAGAIAPSAPLMFN